LYSRSLSVSLLLLDGIFMWNKKADEFMNWPEIACFLTLLLGFLFALSTQSTFLKYVVLFIVGLSFGRMCYLYIKLRQVHLILIIVGFLLGFVLGTQADIRAVLLVFMSGLLLSFYAHKNKWVPLL